MSVPVGCFTVSSEHCYLQLGRDSSMIWNRCHLNRNSFVFDFEAESENRKY